MRTKLLSLLSALALTLAVLPCEAGVIGGNGDIYEVAVRQKSEVLGPSEQSAEDFTVLVLSIRSQDGDEQQVIVPGTEDWAMEYSPFVAYESSSQTLFVIWESRVNFIHSSIQLIGYHEGEWTDRLNISGDAFTWKSTPRLAVTRDVYSLGATAAVGEGERSRTIIHVVWREETNRGHVLMYAPVILIDGRYVGQHALLTIDDIVASDVSPPWVFEAPVEAVITPSPTGRSVTIGAVVPSTGLFTTFRVSILEADLAALAEEIERWLIEHEDRYGDLRSLADGMRGHMIDFGARVGNDIIRNIADGMRGHMIDFGARHDGDVRHIAREMRGHMIDFGLALEARDLRTVHSALETAPVIDLLDAQSVLVLETDRPQVALAHVGRFRTLLQQPVMEIGAGTDALMLVSADGRRLIHVWQADENHLAYRESDGAGGWKALQQTTLGPRLDRPAAVRLLQEKIDR